MSRNNGIVYHSHGDFGAFFGTWMSGVEFEVVPRSVGMLLTVGDSQGMHSFDTVNWRVGATVPVASDPAIAYPRRRYFKGGLPSRQEFPTWNVEAGVDAEKPLGQWNSLDLDVFGDRAIHVVNGVPVLAASDFTTTDAAGKRIPLVAGRWSHPAAVRRCRDLFPGHHHFPDRPTSQDHYHWRNEVTGGQWGRQGDEYVLSPEQIEQFHRDGDVTLRDLLTEDDLVVELPLKRGDITVHDEMIIHGSGGNRSADRWRRTCITAFRSAACVAFQRAIGFTHSHNDNINWETHFGALSS